MSLFFRSKPKYKIRKCDSKGCGSFGASRGSRKHEGIDLVLDSGDKFLSPVDGKVTKIGFPYADDLNFRYVQVTDKDDKKHRFFYLSPSVVMFQKVKVSTILGYGQTLKTRYHGITDHVHYEVKINGSKVNPTEFIDLID